MKKYKLFVNKFAEKDIENLICFYDKKRIGLGDEFLMKLKEIIIRIEENPYQFPKIEKEARKASLKKFPYAVFFVIKNKLINIFSVFHFSKNPKTWKNRITALK